jgi:hypothetical protein
MAPSAECVLASDPASHRSFEESRAIRLGATIHMTSDQYRNAIGRLGLTQAQAASFMGISIRTSHGYANGETIPRVVELLLKAMLRWDIKPSEL